MQVNHHSYPVTSRLLAGLAVVLLAIGIGVRYYGNDAWLLHDLGLLLIAAALAAA